MSGPSDEPKRRRIVLTPIERIRWGREVVALKASGKTWPEIVTHTGLNLSKCKRLEKEYRLSGDPEEASKASMDWVNARIDTLKVVMAEASATYMSAPEGSAVRVGAMKLLNDTSAETLEIAMRMGWVPHNLRVFDVQRRMQEMFREFAELAREHDVSDEYLQAVRKLAEQNLSGQPVIEGRALSA